MMNNYLNDLVKEVDVDKQNVIKFDFLFKGLLSLNIFFSFFVFIFFLIGRNDLALFCLYGLLISLLVLYNMYKKRKIYPYLYIFQVILTLYPLIYTFKLGGIFNASGVVMWSMLVIIAAIIFEKENKIYMYWIGLYILELILSIALQFIYNNNPEGYWLEVTKLDQIEETLFLFFNIIGVSLTTIYGLSTFYTQREKLRENTEKLLDNMLPKDVIADLSSSSLIGTRAVKQHKNVIVIFIDLVDFSALSQKLESIALVNLLNNIFFDFDQLAEKYHMEKIKTIGDGYMVVSGIQKKTPDQYIDLSIRFCLEVVEHAKSNPLFLSHNIKVRIGVDIGEVVSGIIGMTKFAFDLWGVTVNTASRMEQLSQENSILITNRVYQEIKDHFVFSSAEEINVKGKGLEIVRKILACKQ